MMNFPFNFGFYGSNNVTFGQMNFNWQNNYLNNYSFTPLFNFGMQFPTINYQMPVMPSFNFFPSFGQYNFTPATQTNNEELNPKQKSQMEEIQKLKYDSKELQAKLNENDNIQDYAKFLENNKDYKVVSTIDVDDGGKIYLYEDSSGNRVGSVNKDSKGKIRNVALNIADGGEVSLNEDNKDGKIDSMFAMSKQQKVEKKQGTTYKAALAQILKNYKGYKVSSDKSDNGTTVEHYFYKDKEIASVIKDKKGKITSLSQYDVNKSNGKETRYFYGDINKDGKIDKGEVKVRYDIDLS